MKKRIIIFNIAVVFVALLLMFGLGIIVTRSNQYAQAEHKIKQITAIYALNYSEDAEFTQKIDEDIRITVIDATGKVIADSEQLDISGMENHIYREEIQAAANGTPKAVTRKSKNVGVDMMYYAEKVETEGSYVFVRVAIPVDSVFTYVNKALPLSVMIMFFALVASVVASIFFSGTLLKPLETVKNSIARIGKGNYRQITPATEDADINNMLVSINDISSRLEQSINDARNEKDKLDYIFNNVSDGIIVFDKDMTITAANRVTENIFGIKECIGKTAAVFTSDKAFLEAVEDCSVNKNDSVFRLETENAYYLCSVRNTESGMVIVVLTDITASEKSEEMRLQFFANASHELKTPLTAIKGFNDMVTLSSKDKKIKEYSEKISKETDRMVLLIDDMLNLSKLENSSAPSDAAEVDLKEIADEVSESLTPLAMERKVTLSVTGSARVRAEREHMYELIKNLFENAIRYNKEGGKAEIILTEERGTSKLEVKDNGIGIDAEHQGRIFERFYRVDKSRSRATGGTGLGLAIVKHISELYGAEIDLKSRLGAGTDITVSFKNKNR